MDVADDVQQHVDARPSLRDRRAVLRVEHVELRGFDLALLFLERLEAGGVDVRRDDRRPSRA
jgi:hypothetical protein